MLKQFKTNFDFRVEWGGKERLFVILKTFRLEKG